MRVRTRTTGSSTCIRFTSEVSWNSNMLHLRHLGNAIRFYIANAGAARERIGVGSALYAAESTYARFSYRRFCMEHTRFFFFPSWFNAVVRSPLNRIYFIKTTTPNMCVQTCLINQLAIFAMLLRGEGAFYISSAITSIFH